MEQAPLLSILAVSTGVGLLGLIGGILLFWRESVVKRWTYFFISFAAGGLLGASFFDLLPEALEETDNIPRILWYVLLGVLVFFTVEKLLVWHHHAHPHDLEPDGTHESHIPQRAALRPLVILGDGLHNFLDGVVIAVTFLIEPNLGWITAAAVVAHEIPQEVGDFSILLSSGMRRGRVLFWNVFGVLLGTLGALVGFYADEAFGHIELPLLGFAAGNFVYIALADLFPTIQHERRFRHSIAHVALIVLGLAVLWWFGRIFPHA